MKIRSRSQGAMEDNSETGYSRDDHSVDDLNGLQSLIKLDRSLYQVQLQLVPTFYQPPYHATVLY